MVIFFVILLVHAPNQGDFFFKFVNIGIHVHVLMCIYVRSLAPTTMHFDGTTLDASCFSAFGFRDNMVIDFWLIRCCKCIKIRV
jgi:hypothetical protein